MQYQIDPNKFAGIFGPKDDLNSAPGRSRRCKSCGGWHERGKVPHNCLPERAPRNPNLAAPQIAPAFEPFRTGYLNQDVIGSRNEKRDYMERNDLAEYDEGVTNTPTWVEERREVEERIEAIKMFAETDTEADVWDEYHEASEESQGDLITDGVDVDTTDITKVE